MEYLDFRAEPHICTSLFLCKEGKLLLGLRHYTPETFKRVSLWTTPGGRCEEGEKIADNIARETLEETGIADQVIERYLGQVPGAKLGDTLYVYQGTTASEPRLMEPEKFSEWRWFNPAEVPENFINPRALELFRKNNS